MKLWYLSPYNTQILDGGENPDQNLDLVLLDATTRAFKGGI